MTDKDQVPREIFNIILEMTTKASHMTRGNFKELSEGICQLGKKALSLSADLTPTIPDDKVAEAIAWLEKEMARGFYSMPEDQQAVKTLINHIRSRHAPSLKDALETGRN